MASCDEVLDFALWASLMECVASTETSRLLSSTTTKKKQIWFCSAGEVFSHKELQLAWKIQWVEQGWDEVISEGGGVDRGAKVNCSAWDKIGSNLKTKVEGGEGWEQADSE